MFHRIALSLLVLAIAAPVLAADDKAPEDPPRLFCRQQRDRHDQLHGP